MTGISTEEIKDSIKETGWFRFGDERFECPGLLEENIIFYIKNGKLPNLCDECYKALIFWDRKYSDKNLINFFKMINSFEVNYWGKLNDGVVVFYFRNKNKMLKFLKFLENEMKKFQVEGKVQWRRACKKYQNSRPELWKNAKEFIPDDENEVEFTEEEFKKFSRDMKKAGIKMKTVRN